MTIENQDKYRESKIVTFTFYKTHTNCDRNTTFFPSYKFKSGDKNESKDACDTLSVLEAVLYKAEKISVLLLDSACTMLPDRIAAACQGGHLLPQVLSALTRRTSPKFVVQCGRPSLSLATEMQEFEEILRSEKQIFDQSSCHKILGSDKLTV